MGIRIELLGRFVVTVDGRTVPTDRWALRARHLTALLASSAGRRLHREQVVDRLWPHLEPAAGVANLHKAAHLVRKATGDARSVVLTGGTVHLWPDRSDVDVDAVAFEMRARRAVAAADRHAARTAARAYRGAFLTEDPYEDWTFEPRHRLRALHEQLTRMGTSRRTPATGRVRSREFTGRAVESARLRGALHRAAQGRTTAVLLRGPAGIGKTTLLRRAVADAAAAGWATLTGVAGPATVGVPYALLRQSLSDLSAARSTVAGDLSAADRAVIDRVVAGTRTATVSTLPRHAVLGALCRLTISCADERGLIVAVDDADDLDAASADLIRELGRSPGRPLLIVLAFRAATSDILAALSDALLGAGAVTVDVGPLSRRESRQLVRVVGGDAVTDAAAAAMVEQSGGVPFRLRLLAEAARRGEPLSDRDFHDHIAARLCGGDAALAADLRLLACAGSVDAALLVGLLQDPRRAARVVASGAIELADGVYRWRHRLLRDALLSRIPGHDRPLLHGVVADRLRALGADPLDVARHLLAAGRGREAVPLLVEGADAAAALAAWSDALALVDTAADHAPADPDVLARRAHLSFMTGDPGAALMFGRAAAAADPGTDRDRLRYGQAWAWLAVGDLPAAEHALAVVHPEREPRSSHEAVVRAMLDCFAGRLDEAERLATTARALAEVEGRPAAVVDAAFVAGMVAHSRGELPLLLHREVLVSAGLPEVAGLMQDGYLCPVQNWLSSGEPVDRIAAFAARLRDAATTAGAERGRAFATVLLGQALFLAGDPTGAAAYLEDAREMHAAVDAPGGETLALVTSAQLAVATGHAAAAAPLLAAATDTARRSPLITWHLLPRIHGARVAAAAPAEVVDLVDRAMTELRGPEDRCPSCWVSFAIPAALAAVRAGRRDIARTFVDQAAAVITARQRHGGWVAALAEAHGHLDTDADAARAAFTEAFEEYERCGRRLDATRCRRMSTLV